MDLNSQHDDIRKRKLEEAPRNAAKIQKLIQDIDNVPETEQTNELKESKLKLSRLLKEYLNSVDYYRNEIFQGETSDEEILDGNLVHKILAKKKVSKTEILLLETEGDYVKVKLIPYLDVKDIHKFTLKITNKKGVLGISDYNLPNFIPCSLEVDMKTGNFQSIDDLIARIVCYLEAYLLRREDVFKLKEKFVVPKVVKELEYCTAFSNITFAIAITSREGDSTIGILLNYPYESEIAKSVNFILSDDVANLSWLQSVRNDINIFKECPLFEAFCRFSNISESDSE